MHSRTRILMFLAGFLLIATVAVWIYGGKKSTSTTELTIQAPASKVFPYLHEPEKIKLWFQGMEDITTIHEEEDHIGSRYQVTISRGGRSVQYENRILRFRSNEQLTVQSENAQQTLTLVFQLQDISTAECQLTFRTHQVNMGIGRLFYAIDPGNHRQEKMSSDIRTLKQIVEADLKTP